jgi:hypothetical protein
MGAGGLLIVPVLENCLMKGKYIYMQRIANHLMPFD